MRSDFDRLKATLTNCVRYGPESQGCQRAHLLGRITFVESIHATRGQKLREIFSRIRWADGKPPH